MLTPVRKHRLRARRALLTAVATLALAPPHASHAEIIAADSAANQAYAYDPIASWQGLNSTIGENPVGNDNGGFGFAPWDFSGGYHNPNWSPYDDLSHFIDGVDFPASSFNDLGSPAFGLTNANRASFGFTARATRTFAALEVGDVLSVDFDNPLLQPLDLFSPSGFLFRLNTGEGPVIDDAPLPGVQERFGAFTTSGFNGGRWYTTDANQFTDTGVADSLTASGATFRFMLTSDESYSVEFMRRSDGQVLFSRSAFLANPGAGGIDSLEITLFGNGSGDGAANGSPTGEREFFFNNLRISSGDGYSPGDFDVDRDVDGNDFLRWQQGASPNPLSDPDLSDWRSNYGWSESLFASNVAVPEPSASWLVLLACAAGASFKQRPQSQQGPRPLLNSSIH